MNVDPCMAAYGIAVAAVAPRLLGQYAATEGAPRLGVAAWLLAATSVMTSWLAAGISLIYHPGAAAQAVGAVIVAGLSIRLTWAWLVTWRATRSSRIRHTEAALMLGRPDSAIGAVVVDSPDPAAYCLPQPGGGGLIVVTAGARAALSPRELHAVLSHERAHLEGRHHLLISIGQVLARSLPALRLFRQVGRQVPRLLEMRADDAAARAYGRDTVASAIVHVSMRGTPSGAVGAGGPAATARALRLIGSEPKPLRSRVILALMALALALGPYLITLPACPHPW